MKFVIVTKDFSGLGFAIMLQHEGHEVLIAYQNDELQEKDEREQEAFYKVGSGIVDCATMKTVFGKRDRLRDAYWIFDSNHLYEYGDKLRGAGFKVWGASKLTHDMEHDRNFGMSVAEKAGFNIAESQQFNNVEQAIKFLEQNEDKSYVCKPNDAPPEAHLTYVPAEWETPAEGNRELRAYLPCMDSTDFVIQEKIRGLEVNIECFVYKGTPYFAWVDFECKRKNSGDKGELVGCSQDIGFVTEMDNGIVTKIASKMFAFYKSNSFTGFGDVNVILADNEIYFVEYCNRFGFNAHVNLFKNLLISPFSETIAAMIDGKIENFYDRFRKGFGAAITMYIDHPANDFPIYVDEDVEHKFYHYDSFRDESCETDDDFRLAGFSNEVGVICGYGFTPKDAAKDALDKALKINFPMCAYREDLDEIDYLQSPIKRHEALNAMGLIHRHL